jgi:hypothetical protein
MMNQYYIVQDGDKKGPFSLEELRKLDFDRNILVWHKGLDNWQKANEVKELEELLSNAPPPIPNLQNSSVQNIKIESPVEVNFMRKNKISKEEIAVKQRKVIKGFFSEIGYLLLYFTISVAIALWTYQFYFETNRPELVSDENQYQFNREFRELQNKGSIVVPFGDIASKYLGFFNFKYDQNLGYSDLNNINEARISILKEKTEEISYYTFFLIISILVGYRYLSIFLKWLNPQTSKTTKDTNDK